MSESKPADTSASARRKALALVREHFPEAMLVTCWQTSRKTTKIRMDYLNDDCCVLTSSFIGPYLDLIDAGGGVSVSHESEYDTSARAIAESGEDEDE